MKRLSPEKRIELLVATSAKEMMDTVERERPDILVIDYVGMDLPEALATTAESANVHSVERRLTRGEGVA